MQSVRVFWDVKKGIDMISYDDTLRIVNDVVNDSRYTMKTTMAKMAKRKCVVCGKELEKEKHYVFFKKITCSNTCRIIKWARNKEAEINKDALQFAKKGFRKRNVDPKI